MRSFFSMFNLIRSLEDTMPSSNFTERPASDLATFFKMKLPGNPAVVIESEGIGQTAVWQNALGEYYIQDIPISAAEAPQSRPTPEEALELAEQMAGCIPAK